MTPTLPMTQESPIDTLPAAVQQAWAEGRQVDAIRQLRAARPALSLQAAKDLLEGRAQAPAWQPGQPLPAEVQAALRAQQPVEAIRRLRAVSGLGLQDAKALVEAATGGDAPGAAPPLAPGEQPAARWVLPLALVLGLAALGGWLVLA